jgi:hypothetical protein
MARLPDPPLVSDPVRSDDEYRRLFWGPVADIAVPGVFRCGTGGISRTVGRENA